MKNSQKAILREAKGQASKRDRGIKRAAQGAGRCKIHVYVYGCLCRCDSHRIAQKVELASSNGRGLILRGSIVKVQGATTTCLQKHTNDPM